MSEKDLKGQDALVPQQSSRVQVHVPTLESSFLLVQTLGDRVDSSNTGFVPLVGGGP